MSESKLSERVALAQTRMASLHQRAGYSLLHQEGLLPDAFEELHATLDELRIAEEDMRSQNEELIAVRRQVEAERQRYQDLFEFAPDAYFVTTLDGAILEANQAASQLLNLTPPSLRKRSLTELVADEDREEFHTRLTRLPTTSTLAAPQEWTVRLRRRLSAPFFAALTVAPVSPLSHDPATLRWMARDITDRRQTEEARLALAQEQSAHQAAEEGRQRIEAILETITDTFITLDTEWRFIYLNASAARLCRAAGKDPDRLIGRLIWEEFPTALGTAFQTEALRAVETNQMTEFEEFSRGLGRWLQVRVFPSETGVVAYAQDVTSRKETEAALQTAYLKERRIAGILQNLLLRTVPSEAFSHLTVETFYQAASSEALIGGDFFDVFTLGAGLVALVVGDVSGKGLAAAEMTAAVKYALRAILREAGQPAPGLARLNEFVCEAQRQGDLGSDHLVALSLVVMESDTGEAIYVSAGSEPVLLLRADGAMEEEGVGGLLLGVQSGADYLETRFQLNAGDTLMMATDGLTEARRRETGALLGSDGLQRLASEARFQTTLNAFGQSLLDGAHTWTGGALQDDACLLLVRRRETNGK